MSTNCFIDNAPRIAPVLIDAAGRFDNGYGEPATSNYLQRTNGAAKPPTGCTYVSSAVIENTTSLRSQRISFTSSNVTCSSPSFGSHVCKSRHMTLPSSSQLPCISSLVEINRYERAVVRPEIARTYVLCPHSEYELLQEEPLSDSADYMLENYTGPVDLDSNGTSSILMYQPNMRILCGHSGSRENSCVIHGGKTQIHVGRSSLKADHSRTIDFEIHGLLIRGVTFTEAAVTNVYAADVEASLTIEDCLFEVRMGQGGRAFVQNSNFVHVCFCL
jgi:hypothetical protein